MRRYRTVMIIALVGIVPMIAALFAVRVLLPGDEAEQVQAAAPAQPAQPQVVEPKLRMVLAAARDLPVGTLLGEGDFTELALEPGEVGRTHLPLEDLGADEMPYGHVVRTAVDAGAPLSWPALVGPRQRGFLAAVLKPGTRAITIRLGPGTRHSGLVDPGDRVDVVLTAASPSGGGRQSVVARTILEDVRVLAIDRWIGSAAPGSPEHGGEVKRSEIVTATLEVLPEQTGLLALGEHEGELALAVRPLAAAGDETESAGTVDLHELLVGTSETRQATAPSLEKMVRVIRGTEVAGETFSADNAPAPPGNVVFEAQP